MTIPLGVRKLKVPWLDAFTEFTKILPSPAIFRKWAGIATIAGALERRVWVRTFNMNLYPNLYVLLIAPPGVGKTVVTHQIQKMWSELKNQFQAPSSLSRASLVDALGDAKRHIVRPAETPSVHQFNSLKLAVNELSTLIPGYDQDFMSALTDIYDCHRYGERKRTKDLNSMMEAPQLNLIASTTPSYLNETLPPGAWDQGFISRVIMIFSAETLLRKPFEEIKSNGMGYDELIHDLKIIGQDEFFGKVTFEDEAANALTYWHEHKGPPTPEHPKLMHYNTRRTTHLLKLCMVASASRGNDRIVTVEDYNIALNWLIEAETVMPDVFKVMAAGGDAKVIDDAWYWASQAYVREGKPISEARIINFLQQRTPAHNVMRMIEIMVKGGSLVKQLDAYVPQIRNRSNS